MRAKSKSAQILKQVRQLADLNYSTYAAEIETLIDRLADLDSAQSAHNRDRQVRIQAARGVNK